MPNNEAELVAGSDKDGSEKGISNEVEVGGKDKEKMVENQRSYGNDV